MAASLPATDRADAVVGDRGGNDVAAGGADAQGADPVGADLRAGGEVGDGVLDVLDTLGGVLGAAGGAAALALIGGVVGERDESGVGKSLGVGVGGLLLDAGAGMSDDHGGERAVGSGVGGVQVAGEGDPGAGEGHIGSHDPTVLAVTRVRERKVPAWGKACRGRFFPPLTARVRGTVEA